MKRLALYLISVVTVAMGLVSCKGDGKSLITDMPGALSG